jgi:hypothetical protein
MGAGAIVSKYVTPQLVNPIFIENMGYVEAVRFSESMELYFTMPDSKRPKPF